MNDRPKKSQELAQRFAAADALDAPLDAKLAAYSAGLNEVATGVLDVYDRLVTHLGTAEVGRGAPQIGDEFPHFVMPDSEGRLVSSREMLASGPLVVSLNRGHWCPYCRLELRALARAKPHLQRRGAQVIAIVPETGEFTAKVTREHALPFRVLSDIDLGYALSLGLAFPIGQETTMLYHQLGIDLPRYHNNDAWLLPIPATFVVDAEARIRAGFVNPDFRKRMTIEQIEAALQA